MRLCVRARVCVYTHTHISWAGRGSGLLVALSIEYVNRSDWADRGSGIYAAYRTEADENRISWADRESGLFVALSIKEYENRTGRGSGVYAAYRTQREDKGETGHIHKHSTRTTHHTTRQEQDHKRPHEEPPSRTSQRSKVARRRCVPPPTSGWVAAPKSAWEVGSKSDAPWGALGLHIISWAGRESGLFVVLSIEEYTNIIN